MHQIIFQEENKLEMALTGKVSKDDFNQVIHQWESMCTMHPKINVMLNALDVESFDLKILWDEFDFYKNYKKHLNRFALVSDRKIEKLILEQFNKFSDTEFKTFPEDKIEEARKWIFPSRLP